MELKNGMTVISPCNGQKIKEGQEFVVSSVGKSILGKEIGNYLFFFEISFEGKKLFCLLKACAHINYSNWIIKK